MIPSVLKKEKNEIDNMSFLFIAYLIAVLPHVPHLPWWAVFGCFGLWGYALGARERSWPSFGRGTRIVLAAIGLAGVTLTYGRVFSLEAGTCAAAILMAIKPFEIHAYRDQIVTLLGIYFLLLARVFISQDLGVAVYTIAAVLVIQGVMTRIVHEKGGFGSHIKLSAGILLQSLPIVVVLFIFFPRLPGGLGFSYSTAQTGFSDTLSPGDVSRIIQNDDVAFRVSFQGPVPDRELLYWRGLVFLHFDGRRWHPGDRFPPAGMSIEADDRVDYSIILQPHGHRWVFVLDVPVRVPDWTRLLSDFSVRTYRPVTSAISLDITSYTEYNTGQAFQWDKRALVLPPNGNPKARRLAEKWGDSARTPEEIMKEALEFFQYNDFAYTTSPGTLPEEDNMDAFLFQRRKGFCGHFASAYCFLMRAAGVPARIVAGYQGGRINPVGGYLMVRQADAHAWVEVLLPEKGWVRVDPTAAVAPQRLESGWDALSPAESRSAGVSDTGTFDWFGLPLEKVAQIWDTANFSWDRFALGFTHSRQKEVLSGIGIETTDRTGRLLALAVGLATAILFGYFSFAWYRIKRPRSKPDPVPAIYRRFTKKLSGIGLPRPPHQGPMDFARTVIQKRPDLEAPVREITRRYIALRYARKDDRDELKALKKAVGKFHPKS